MSASFVIISTYGEKLALKLSILADWGKRGSSTARTRATCSATIPLAKEKRRQSFSLCTDNPKQKENLWHQVNEYVLQCRGSVDTTCLMDYNRQWNHNLRYFAIETAKIVQRPAEKKKIYIFVPTQQCNCRLSYWSVDRPNWVISSYG